MAEIVYPSLLIREEAKTLSEFHDAKCDYEQGMWNEENDLPLILESQRPKVISLGQSPMKTVENSVNKGPSPKRALLVPSSAKVRVMTELD